ncbi:putative nuclease HARBI1 [Phalaenopsis equestris]|uniref:putative nuclease HARBI1 n=1 Tax=Phalaenopsis equestris TaxID=78828 RepID=UPI0009E2FD02|nr:putative nuclease HARBI1 [Phalaenopsis equestris]
MTQEVFTDLLAELVGSHGLHGSMRMTDREVLAITLYILSQNESMRGAMERFQHSSETISRYFSVGLSALESLAKQVIKPLDPTFSRTPAEIRQDRRYMPFFKDCIGAIDGTHVDARVSNEEKVAFIGRSGSTTQNVMAVCDFNMCFTFIMPGWEGSAHDSRIFKSATRNPHYSFPHPPQGKYYLLDAGYPLQRGYLKLYPDTRYHIPDFERASNVTRNRKEVFNKRHSSLRGVIEQTFGVWKKKWVILRDMPPYPFPKQVQIVIATMTIHNYIRRHPSRHDVDFLNAEANQRETVEDSSDNQMSSSMLRDDSEQLTICNKEGEGATEMAAIREQITNALVNM